MAGLTTLAGDFMTRRTSALVWGHDTARGDEALANNVAHESAAVLGAERAALAELVERRDALSDWGERYTDGSSRITVQRVTTQGDTVTLDVEELSRLSYAKVNGHEPEYTAFMANRRFVFNRHGTTWRLDSAELLGDGAPPVNEPTGAGREEMRTALQQAVVASNQAAAAKPAQVTRTGVSPQGEPITVSYNYTAMAAYAERYWYYYNTSYRNFNNSGNQGGDCTNFVSQIMRAGGWADDTGWYRDPWNWWYNSLNQTWSWINVGYWFQFAAQYSRRTYILSNVWYMGLADVLQADFSSDGVKDHSMTVSYVGDQPYLTYHSDNTYRRSLSSILATSPTGTWWAHRT
ncbi:MAG TPA: amidase domain-containing protein [Micromonosporaceae bacterium]|nr:amidase domain-containing protein [Micromonosporaceae bacterium]